jgi:uncharacterized cupin superfamily protein
VEEGKLDKTDAGLVPKGEGWYILNARDATWRRRETLGSYCDFDGDAAWPQLGVNICVLEPGRPNCMYHREAPQEGFLVISGECLVLVEGEERRLRRWDYFHCPPWTEHVFVGAGDEPCVIVMAGARGPQYDDVVYPVDDVALKHDAGVEEETDDPQQAYARFVRGEPHSYPHGDLLPPG